MEIRTIEQTMSSMEIAQLTGKQHSHIMRDIRELNRAYQNLNKSKIGLKQKISDLGRGRKRKDPYFELTKMQTLDLLTGYSTELRIKVNHRWAELEAKEVLRMPKPIDVHGMEALPYDHWLLMNDYSVSNGQRSARIRKYPQHFYMATNGKWYISKLYADTLLKIREGKKQIEELKPLPSHEQMVIDFFDKARQGSCLIAGAEIKANRFTKNNK